MKTKYRSSKQSLVSAVSVAERFPHPPHEVVIPVSCSYENLPTWIKTNFTKEIFLTEKAMRSLKKADYQDVRLVYQAIKILATHYQPMRKGRISKNDFKQKCHEAGLDYRLSSTRVTAGKHGDKYFVKYNGKRQRLEFHLTKGSSKEPRKCLRIYFFWDEDNELVVIGHLPDHLDNSKS